MTDFKAKMHQIRFRFFFPDPAGEAYSAPADPLAGFGGHFAAGEGVGLGKKRERGKGKEGEVEGREREGPQVTVEPGPLRALLRHCPCALLPASPAASHLSE